MKVVLTLSGGLDSTILFYYLLQRRGDTVRCLSVDYGQRHRKELDAAREIAALAGCEHRVADLREIRDLLAGSSQTSDDVQVPDGHYTDESMKQTVVPNRNMILLSLATAWAVSTKSDCVAYAAHAGDHAIYPDCREEFAEALGLAVGLCDWHKIHLSRPFITMTKGEVVKLAHESLKGVPLHKTWSCYKGGLFHCGVCGTCVERKEAFCEAGVDDPTRYLTDHQKED